jgi:hypothetical protein
LFFISGLPCAAFGVFPVWALDGSRPILVRSPLPLAVVCIACQLFHHPALHAPCPKHSRHSFLPPRSCVQAVKVHLPPMASGCPRVLSTAVVLKTDGSVGAR